MKKIFFLVFALLFSVQISNAQEIYFQTGHTGGISEVRFSPDDSRLISYSPDDGNLILWDVRSGKQIWLRETGFIRRDKEKINLEEFYWSKDEKFIITKSANGTYQTFDAQTGNVLALTETKPEIEVISQTKKPVIYTRDYQHTTITDSESGATKQFETYGIGNGFETSYDGEMIAEGGGYNDGFVKITNIKSDQTSWLGAHPGIIKEIKFSPDGKVFAVAGNDLNIYIFDAQKHLLLKTLTGHQKPVEKIAFSSDGKLLISSAAHDAVNIWNWQDAEIIKSKKAFDWLRFSSSIIPLDANVDRIITRYDSPSFEIRDTQNWEIIRQFKTKEKYKSKSIRGFSFTYESVPGSVIRLSADGKKIFANYADGKIRIWDVETAKLIREIKADTKECQVKILPDEKSLLAFCPFKEKEKIKRIDLATGKVLRVYADEEGEDDEIFFTTQFINAIELSPDGKYFVTTDTIGDGLLWSVDQAKPVREFDTEFTFRNVVAFNRDGKTFAVVGDDENIFLFDVETGAKLWQLIPSYQPGKFESELEEKAKKARAGIK